MAEKSITKAPKQKKEGRGIGRKGRRAHYRDGSMRERNCERKKLNRERHLLKAFMRRWRNHPKEMSLAELDKVSRVMNFFPKADLSNNDFINRLSLGEIRMVG